jgi:hypothetical protein
VQFDKPPTDDVGYEEEYVLLLLDIRLNLLQRFADYGMAIDEGLTICNASVLHSAPLKPRALSSRQIERASLRVVKDGESRVRRYD